MPSQFGILFMMLPYHHWLLTYMEKDGTILEFLHKWLFTPVYGGPWLELGWWSKADRLYAVSFEGWLQFFKWNTSDCKQKRYIVLLEGHIGVDYPFVNDSLSNHNIQYKAYRRAEDAVNDCDTAPIGVSYSNASSSNRPDNYCLLVTWNLNNTYGIQLAFSITANKSYLRRYNVNTGWASWVTLH